MEGLANLDSNDLAKRLRNHLSSGLISKLKDQGVTGAIFANLTGPNLLLFGFSLGEVTDVTKLIDDIRGGREVLLETDESSSSEDSGDEGMNSRNSNNNNQNSIESMERSLMEYIVDDEEDFVKNQTWYWKISMFERLEQWKKCVAQNFPCASAPNLGECKLKDPLPLQRQSKSLNAPLPIHSTSNRALRSRVPTTTNDRLQTSVPRESECSSQLSAQSRAHPAAHQSTGFPRRILPQSVPLNRGTLPRQQLTAQTDGGQKEPENFDNIHNLGNEDSDPENSEDDELDQQFLKDKENMVKPTFPLKSAEVLLAIEPNLPSFDVEDILLADDKAKKLVPYLKDGYLLPSRLRKLVYRTLMRHLYNNHVGHVRDVTSQMKHGMAKSIVTTYTQYQTPVTIGKTTPWAHLFFPSKNSGQLANIMKRAQTALPLKERARKGKIKKPTKKRTPATCEINIQTLAVMMPDRAHREEIFDGMQRSFELRCDARANGLSITELINQYPHFLNYSGELISMEFQLLHPNAQDMCVEMMPIIPKVVEKWNDARVNPKFDDSTMKAFLILASRLPHAIQRNMGTAFPQEEEVLVVVNRGIDLEQFVVDRRNQSTRAVQPYLLGVRGALVSTELLKVFLVLDNNLIELPRLPLLRAIDILFKSYIIFNVHYPLSWRNFFKFIQTCFYKILCSEDACVPPSCIELYGLACGL